MRKAARAHSMLTRMKAARSHTLNEGMQNVGCQALSLMICLINAPGSITRVWEGNDNSLACGAGHLKMVGNDPGKSGGGEEVEELELEGDKGDEGGEEAGGRAATSRVQGCTRV